MGSFGGLGWSTRLPEAQRGPGAAGPGGVKGAGPLASLSPILAFIVANSKPANAYLRIGNYIKI